MSSIDLDYSDVTDIIKNSLKIENLVKSIKSIFLTLRYFDKVDYKPYFQREYVWDNEKATYFIESIILGTEIPPLVLFQVGERKEVIDGRQRYETINRYLNDDFALKSEGLKTLQSLAGVKYSKLSPELREVFESTRIRILQCTVVNEPNLSAEKEDKIKKQIFKRYNSGITSLQKEEIERADYITDKHTISINEELNRNKPLYDKAIALYLPKNKIKANDRDKINILSTKIRTLLTLPFIPVSNYAYAKSKQDMIKKFYKKYVDNMSIEVVINHLEQITEELYNLLESLKKINSQHKDSKLVYEVFFWLYSILYENTLWNNIEDKCDLLSDILINIDRYDVWKNIDKTDSSIDGIFEATGSHYYKSIINRYQFALNCAEQIIGTSINYKMNDLAITKDIMKLETPNDQVKQYQLNKAKPESLLLDDIIDDMQKNKFLIRPLYQRNEVKNNQKASYLMESIILGIQIPPIYVYKRSDGIKEVIDGQQRILTILGFLGRPYINELGQSMFSEKNKFKLSKLKILSELNGCNIDKIDDAFINKVLEFSIDVIEIDQSQNSEFDPVDLFLRLNTKPYPIKDDSFEMWNAYIDKEIILKVKSISKNYQEVIFRKKDTRMKLEELITSLAYLSYNLQNDFADILDSLNIYVRKDRINARIINKERITKVLVDESNSSSIKFLKALNNIEEFCQKLCHLEESGYNLQSLFAHPKKTSNYKTDQNFYLIWCMLRNLSLNDIKSHSEKLYSKIKRLFEFAQSTPENYKIEDFILELNQFKL